MTEAVPNYSELNKEVERQLEEARIKIQGVIQSVFADFFRKFPEVYGIGWLQYTPSWNDGDSTEFSVHDINLYLTEDSAESNDGDQYMIRRPEKIEAVGGETRVREILAHFKPVETFMSNIDEANMQLIFGDGARILATKDGLEVEEYEDDNY